MKPIFFVIVILGIFFVGFYLGRGNLGNTNNRVIGGIDSIDLLQTISGGNVPEKQDLGSSVEKNGFTAMHDFSSFEKTYSEFKQKIPVIENILAQGRVDEIYGNKGIDVFIAPAYLCHVIDTSSSEEQLKKNMNAASGVLLISGDDTFGGQQNIQNYNSILEQYYTTDESYSDFYERYLQNFTILMSSESIESDVKTLGQVVGGIYALGRDKFADRKSIDCYRYLKKNFENIRLDK